MLYLAGKRHGKGEGLIVTDSTAHNGFYSGGWKHNMRFQSFFEFKVASIV